jgi:branched-chain amino acid transport system ATP-binding protein
MSGNWALEVQGLNKKFGSVVAARDITLRFSPGEIVSIIGTNGAGKTTFINMVTGYVTPDAGAVRLFGTDVTNWPPRKIVSAGLGRSFQIPQLFDGLTVWENLMTAAVIGDVGRGYSLRRAVSAEHQDACAHFLGELDLWQYRDAMPHGLAGGTRKLLDIVMALVAKPRLLLLDEPTSGVSEQEKIALMEKVLHVVEGEKMTTILVEHDMEIVRHFSDRVLAFVAGEVAADGLPVEVFSNPVVIESVTGTRQV